MKTSEEGDASSSSVSLTDPKCEWTGLLSGKRGVPDLASCLSLPEPVERHSGRTTYPMSVWPKEGTPEFELIQQLRVPSFEEINRALKIENDDEEFVTIGGAQAKSDRPTWSSACESSGGDPWESIIKNLELRKQQIRREQQAAEARTKKKLTAKTPSSLQQKQPPNDKQHM